jgi:putative sigma-54 modulation protein
VDTVQVVITGRHLEVTPEIREYAEKKAEKLLKYYSRIQEIEVVLGLRGNQHNVKMIVNAEHGNIFTAEEAEDDLYAAVDLVIDKLEKQLTRHKEKVRDRKRAGKTDEQA